MDFREYTAQRGQATRIAKALGITHSAVLQWAERQVPAERALDVERLTGISRHVLRPDVFGPPPEGEPAANGDDPKPLAPQEAAA